MFMNRIDVNIGKFQMTIHAKHNKQMSMKILNILRLCLKGISIFLICLFVKFNSLFVDFVVLLEVVVFVHIRDQRPVRFLTRTLIKL